MNSSPDIATAPRADLVAALRAARPDDATLCEGWQARHLAAHVVLRERRPAHVGLAMARGVDATAELADQAQDADGYARLVDQVEEGPSHLSPVGWFPAANVLEFFVHAQDVRRGLALPASPTELPDPLGDALWRQARVMALGRYRRAASRGGVGLILVTPRARAVVARGRVSAVLTGTAVELALWMTGREAASLVDVGGDPAAVSDFLAAHRTLPPTLTGAGRAD